MARLARGRDLGVNRKTPDRARSGVSEVHGWNDRNPIRIDGIAQPERVIIIKPEAFGVGFDVRIIPPVPDEHLDAEFPTHKRARGWASGLRLTRVWRIVDLTGESA